MVEHAGANLRSLGVEEHAASDAGVLARDPEIVEGLLVVLVAAVREVEARDVHPLPQHLLELGHIPRHRPEGAHDPRLELVVRGSVRRQLLQVALAEVLEDVLLLNLELGQVDVGAVRPRGALERAETIHLIFRVSVASNTGDNVESRSVYHVPRGVRVKRTEDFDRVDSGLGSSDSFDSSFLVFYSSFVGRTVTVTGTGSSQHLREAKSCFPSRADQNLQRSVSHEKFPPTKIQRESHARPVRIG